MGETAHGAAMPSPSEKTEQPGFAWRRFWRLMRGMGLLTLAAVAGTLALFYRDLGAASIHFYIATGIGMALAIMLTAALMGLVFVSNSSGHDRAANDDQAGGGESR